MSGSSGKNTGAASGGGSTGPLAWLTPCLLRNTYMPPAAAAAAPSAMTANSAMRLSLPDEAGLSAGGFAVVEAM
ncbi:hypothetical protein WJ35_11140 [Burkholderia ubonensis]|uniref:Uncharacterized protein n=1 Tax=Burkholderia ubonensis TaxID=101571 RepID=A0A1B4LEG5_9BURK|nr:hypothetical protein WJ35_11140 [Burkholderia ubonensis]